MSQVSTPEQVYKDMNQNPGALKEGLNTITETCIDFANECIREGASGIFFGIGGGGRLWVDLNKQQLETWALKYDKQILEAIDAPIKLLHICSTIDGNPQDNGELMEAGWFKKYPVNAINWDSQSFTSITKAKDIYKDEFCIVGGLDHKNLLRKGTPEEVFKEASIILENEKDGGFIMGPGCTVFQDMPIENFNAIGKAIIKNGYCK
jgi:uroporphyrinogen decarboxylase